MGIAQTSFQKSFEIAIQLGAMMSVVVLYFKSFLNLEVIKKILVAFIPTALIGFVFYPIVKSLLLESKEVVLVALFFGGIALIVFELLHKEHEDATSAVERMSYKQSLLVGLAQSVAIIPGVSRSAATILGGLLLGIKRVTIVEFSFLLAVPTILAATAFDLYQSAAQFSVSEFGTLILGFASAFVVALFSIKFLLAYIRTHTFISFGIYRIVIAVFFWLIIV
jgi:undecaprenyl-diphosphatase